MRWKKLILVEVTAALTSDIERSQENRSKNDKYKAGFVLLGLFYLLRFICVNHLESAVSVL